jgi:hypothetical protein
MGTGNPRRSWVWVPLGYGCGSVLWIPALNPYPQRGSAGTTCQIWLMPTSPSPHPPSPTMTTRLQQHPHHHGVSVTTHDCKDDDDAMSSSVVEPPTASCPPQLTLPLPTHQHASQQQCGNDDNAMIVTARSSPCVMTTHLPHPPSPSLRPSLSSTSPTAHSTTPATTSMSSVLSTSPMASHPALPGPRSHTLVLATTTTRRSCQHDRQSVVVTTHRPALTLRPPHSGPASLTQPLTLTLTPSCPHTLKLATQSDDDDDATIVPARSSQRRRDHLLPSPQHSTPHPYPHPQLPAHPHTHTLTLATTSS